MIALALLLAQAAAAPPSGPDAATFGERVRQFRAVAAKDKASGELMCRIGRSSGDTVIDAGMCEVVKACTPADLSKKPDAKALQGCMMPKIDALYGEWQAGRPAAPATPKPGEGR